MSKVTILVDSYGIKKSIQHSLLYKDALTPIKNRTIILNALLGVSTGAIFDFLPEGQEFSVIWLGDTKPYWRLHVLAERGLHYKGNRPLRTSGEREYGDLFLQCTKDLGINLFKYLDPETSWGYEADDLAATWVKCYHREGDTTILLSNDTDWIPLCKYPGVLWCNIFSYAPRIRSLDNAMTWVDGAQMFSKPFTFHSVEDLWKYKSYYGDRSDNIPAYKDDWEEIYPFISLFSPPDRWNLVYQDNFWLQLLNLTHAPKRRMSYHKFAYLVKTPTCFSPFTEEDFDIFNQNVDA